MSGGEKMRRGYLAVLCFLSAVFTLLFLMANNVQAYPQYSENRDLTNCRACHDNFRTSPYISLHDGVNWGDDNHDVHRMQMLNNDCNTCHGSPFFPVLLGESEGGAGLPPISCMGCHGRTEDDSVANGGACTLGIDCSPGAGLQQHHFNAGVTICLDCHAAANPADYRPVGEDVPPPYYFTPDAEHPDKPADPCDDNFIGGPTGLDNDGDGDYDGNDSDCDPIGCTSNAECDNDEFCDGAETCDQATGECLAGTLPAVDDDVSCTDDYCDEVNDVVVHAPNDGLCDNGAYCDGAETCDAVNDCQAGTPVNIDDGVGCTDDSCDEANDVAVHVPNDGLCDNGMFCNGAETCDAVNDCQAGTPPVIDDGVGCTEDFCNENDDVVVNIPDDSLCDNGQFCDGAETCNEASDCQVGTPPCDPATETCDEAGDVCEPLGCQSDAECDNGMFCDGTETCDQATGECLAGTPPCDPTTETCDEAGDICVEEPAFIDLDIAKFSAPKSVKFAKEKPVEIKLVVKNSGDFNSQTRKATVTGMQNGYPVFTVTQDVSDDVGDGRSTYIFGPYTPTATGDIMWKATIVDDD
jgi:hypothetical protein